MCLQVTRVAGLEPAINISQNPAFHPFTAHNNLPSMQNSAHRTNSPTHHRPISFLLCLFIPLLLTLIRLYFAAPATSGASSTRKLSYARNNKDFNALSAHSRIFAISL